MCGIAGIAYRDIARVPDAAMLRRMTGILRHRGPDGDGFHAAPGIGLGFRRLAIIDLDTGDQPIANEDGSVVVVCNGEIYNHVELRASLEEKGHRFRTRSDVETIVHLYEER
ncbi:MAG TPA: asparagine synthetase B, partial [Casimicrobiaceae bacterium]|nr:asparagine synthetase B [Casimicrobiaceae bacterium]